MVSSTMFLLILPWLNVLLTASVSSCDAFLLPQSTFGGVTRTTTTDRQRWSLLHAASSQEEDDEKKKHVVIVGGGWAGFSAADALAHASDNTNLKITLLDAAPRGKGGLAGGWRTPQGRPVEAGIHGFWREYTNTFAVMERIGLDLDNDVLTPFTPSVLYSSNGRVAVAPVLKETEEKEEPPPAPQELLAELLQSVMKSPLSSSSSSSPDKNLLKPLAALLPVPLDLALLADFSSSSASFLTPADRISAIGLLGAWADFGQEDDQSWARYDAISAENLFVQKAGVTPTLYDELVLPLLHVLPMCPGYDCSAAAALSCFHVFALQARGAFDVRWCRGAIAEKIFNPWAEQLTSNNDVTIQGNSKVASIQQQQDSNGFEITLADNNDTIQCDAVVMAVGGTAMGRLAPASPAFDAVPIAKDFDKLRGVTCVAVRLFLKPNAVVTSNLRGGQYDATQAPPSVAQAMKESPVTVCGPKMGGIPELEETGFCIYDLQRLHDEFAVSNNNNNNDNDTTAVLEVDFFRADDIANLPDDKVAELALAAIAATFSLSPTQMPTTSDIVDLAVVRARNAVSHFAVQSASYSPPVKLYKGMYMAGDWIDRAGHASWSTEKAVVTGRQAAQALLEDFSLIMPQQKPDVCSIIPAAPDSPTLSSLRQGAKVLRSVVPPPGDGVPASPWSFVKSVMARDRQLS